MFNLVFFCILFIGIISSCLGTDDAKGNRKIKYAVQDRGEEGFDVPYDASRDDKHREGTEIQSNTHFSNKNKTSQRHKQKPVGPNIPHEKSFPTEQPECLDTSTGCGRNYSSNTTVNSDISVNGIFANITANGGLRSHVKRSKGLTTRKQCLKFEKITTRYDSAGLVKCPDSDCGQTNYYCNLLCSKQTNGSLCKLHNCSGSYNCLKSNKKIRDSQICDGRNQCPKADDEEDCSTLMRPFCLCLRLKVTTQKAIPPDARVTVSVRPLFNINTPNQSNQNIILLSKAYYLSFDNFQDTFSRDLFSMFPNVIHLDLSYSNMRYLRGGSFIELPHLRQLDLSHNNIRQLSTAVFSGLSSLIILDLSYNKILNFQDNVFSELSGLLHLKLSHNREDKTFEKNIRPIISNGFHSGDAYSKGVLLTSAVFKGLYKLVHLDLSSNYISNIPVSMFEKLSTLKDLDLSNNFIGYLGLRNNMFLGLFGLRSLKLSHNMISYFPDIMFNGLMNLTILDLSYNNLSDSANNLLDRLTSLCDLDLPRISHSFLHDHMFNGLNRLGRLNLSHNQIQLDFPYNIFNGLTSLQILDLTYNQIQTLPGHAFDGIPCIVNIHLSYNGLANINTSVFRDLSRIKNIDFSHNEIFFTDDFMFYGLSNLRKLDLSHNEIFLFDHVFYEMVNLNVLYLSHNNISSIPNETFNGLFKMRNLVISNNRIKTISSEAFSKLHTLTSLDLSHNDLTTIPTFPINAQLTNLDLSYNDITFIQPRSFFNCRRLLRLNVIANPLEVQEQMFDGLVRLKFLFTDTMFACCVKPKSVEDDKCLKAKCFAASCAVQSDAISSCQTLIRYEVLRIFLWIIGVCSVVGNAIVIAYRVILDRDNLTKSYSVFVLNLGISDFFMGVYLVVIGSVDAYYEGVYALNAADWKASLLCSVAGVLSTVSSEMSTFIVLLVTIDRFIVILFPMSRHTGRSITWKQATVVCVILWIVSFMLAVVPTFLAQSYFKGKFYSQSGVCLALPLTAHEQTGSEYSAAVFVGLNSFLFVVILVGQIAIFIGLKRRRNISSQSQRRDMEVAKTLFLVVATDFCCWCPIGVMGVVSLYGYQIPDFVYAWVMVFVLPVNAAINPFLYTLAAVWRRRRAAAAVSRTTAIQLQSRTTVVICGENV